jgi:hypothetical protein
MVDRKSSGSSSSNARPGAGADHQWFRGVGGVPHTAGEHGPSTVSGGVGGLLLSSCSVTLLPDEQEQQMPVSTP